MSVRMWRLKNEWPLSAPPRAYFYHLQLLEIIFGWIESASPASFRVKCFVLEHIVFKMPCTRLWMTRRTRLYYMIETKDKPRPQKRYLTSILFFLYSDSILGEGDKLFIANRSTHYVLITWKQKHHFTIFILFFHKVLLVKSCVGTFFI